MSLTSSSKRGRRRPGRPSALDAEAIAEAVLHVGFRDLTFASVAEALGVSQATVYRYAANRDELIRLGLDLALQRTQWPDLEGPWKPLLERWAIASWNAWAEHPGAVIEVSRGVVPVSIVDLGDVVGAALVERGFSPAAAVLTVDLVFDLVADNRRGVETYDLDAAPGDAQLRERMEQQWLATSATEDTAKARVHAEMLNAIRASPLEWFLGKLRVVLAGIERELAPEPTPEQENNA